MGSSMEGVVHGKFVELAQEPGLPDGQRVRVILQPMNVGTKPGDRLPPGEGVRRSAGAWAEDMEALEEFLKWNRRQRKISRREISP